MAGQVDPRIEKVKDIKRRLLELRTWIDTRYAELRAKQKKLLADAIAERDSKLMLSARQDLEKNTDEVSKTS